MSASARLYTFYAVLCGDDKDSLNGNKLFVVGDPKQSIYRFRGADVNVFARVRRDIAAKKGKNIVLDDNFRTVDKILDFCNATFPDLLGLDSARWIKFLISVMQPSQICWGLTKRRMCFLKRCGPTVQVRFCRNLL